ncbi:Hypothetical protein D9617_6g095560 [Elsinoe fawcettii]|nr:Hypothetical protein D9617_6g095560 [Elsinoe fawcettii]
MACTNHDQDAIHARLLGIDFDEYRRKRFELSCYFDNRFLIAAKNGRPVQFLGRHPDDTGIAKTLDAAEADNPPRPETYLVCLGTRNGTLVKESQLERLVKEMRHYITGVGSPGLGKRACRSRQSERDADRIKAIDEAVVAGEITWDIKRSTCPRDAERRYILTYEDCDNIRSITDEWQNDIDTMRTPMPPGFPALPFPIAPPVRDDSVDHEIPFDIVIKVGATSTPRQIRREYEQHLGDEVLCYLIDAICKTLFPGTGLGIQYFTLRLIHRPELMGMALSLDNKTIAPFKSSRVTKSEELIGPAKPEDFDRNFEEIIHMGVMIDHLTNQRDAMKKDCKRARLYKAEHTAWHEMDDAEKEMRDKERELIKFVSG